MIVFNLCMYFFIFISEYIEFIRNEMSVLGFFDSQISLIEINGSFVHIFVFFKSLHSPSLNPEITSQSAVKLMS